MSANFFNLNKIKKSKRSQNRQLKFRHRQLQHLYVDNLPNLPVPDSRFQHLDNIESMNLDVETNSQISQDINGEFEPIQNSTVNPSLKDYIEGIFSSMMSHVGLNLTNANLVVNLINNLNRRFSSDPVILPNIRYFWEKRSKSCELIVYILCDNNHAHGPYIGEPKLYLPFKCCDSMVTPVLKENKYFLHLPLRSQLKSHLSSIKDSDWQVEIQNQFPSDVSSAIQAKKVKSCEEIETVKRFTLTLHADEVVAGNSSSIKIFPIFASINELKPVVRKRRFFLIGLFVGKKKPSAQVFLNPICEELESLETEPLTWLRMSDAVSIQSTFHVVAVVADAPMRAYLRCARQFNHIHGCDWCLVQASTVNRARIFPNLARNELKDLRRKKDDFLRFKEFQESEESDNENPRFAGLVSVSPLLKLKHLDIVDGFSVEPMHCIILGIFRGIMFKGWLGDDKDIFEKNFNKVSFKKELSRRIVSISVPSDVSRIPRDLEQIKFWKSAEYENFLAYYALPSIRGLLKKHVINHLSCLIKIYFLSSHGTITQDKLEEIQNLIEEFQQRCVEIYGSQFLTYNMHILSHLPESLKSLGPCGNVSSYPLEHYMGILKEKVNRSSNIAPSLVRTFISDFKHTEFLSSKMNNWNLTPKERKDFGMLEVDQNSHTKITYKRKKLNENSKQKILTTIIQSTGFDVSTNCQLCETISINGIRYSSRNYCQDKQRDDSTLRTVDGEYISIQYIIRQNFDEFYLCGQRIRTIGVKTSFKGKTGSFQFDLGYLNEIQNNFLNDPVNMIIPYESISGKCILIQSQKFHFKYHKNFIIDQYLRNN